MAIQSKGWSYVKNLVVKPNQTGEVVLPNPSKVYNRWRPQRKIE